MIWETQINRLVAFGRGRILFSTFFMAISFDELIARENNRFLDFDGKFGYQCVDLLRVYLRDVLGTSPYALAPVTYAKELYKKFNPTTPFIRITNTPTGIPRKGDIIVWDFYPFVTGWAGHVGIFVEGNVNTFISFDQNYPTGRPCQMVKHSYRGVLGWLRKK